MGKKLKVFIPKYKGIIKKVKIVDESSSITIFTNTDNVCVNKIFKLKIYYEDGVKETVGIAFTVEEGKKHKYAKYVNRDIIDIFVIKSYYNQENGLMNYTAALVLDNGLIKVIDYTKKEDTYRAVCNYIKQKKKLEKKLRKIEDSEDDKDFLETLLIDELLDD